MRSTATNKMRPRIFAIADWYLPAVKAGGVVTAIANMVELLGASFEFFIFTRDRDLGNRRPFQNVNRNSWTRSGGAQVFYASNLGARSLRKQLIEVRPDVIFLNSFFSILTTRVLFLLCLGLVPACPVILAPHGEFSPAALGIKRRRKFLLMRIAMAAGFYNGIIWYAVSSGEAQDIQSVLDRMKPKRSVVRLAGQIPAPEWLHISTVLHKPAKDVGEAKFLFLSRIARIKNLLFALEAIRKLSGSVQLDIYGPIEDLAYWKRCQERIRAMPANIAVRYCGSLNPSDVAAASERYHFLVLPTLGENFCHVIPETMAAGCVPVISDKTPWQDLAARGAGWMLPLDDSAAWVECLNRCILMESETFSRYSANAQKYVQQWSRSCSGAEEIAALFHSAAQKNAAPSSEHPIEIEIANLPELGKPICKS